MPARACLIAFWLVLPGPAFAQAAPDPENGRYAFAPASEGVLRLDTRTGQVSHCLRRETGWVCQAVPDERAALESEIGRIQKENAGLKADLLAHGLPLPGSRPPPSPELRLPTEADLDRMMSFLEKIWRRLMDMVQGSSRDYQKKGETPSSGAFG